MFIVSQAFQPGLPLNCDIQSIRKPALISPTHTDNNAEQGAQLATQLATHQTLNHI
jgi:hypothetical protein